MERADHTKNCVGGDGGGGSGDRTGHREIMLVLMVTAVSRNRADHRILVSLVVVTRVGSLKKNT